MVRMVSWGVLLLALSSVGGIAAGIGRRSLHRSVRVVWSVEAKVEVQGFPVDWG